MMAAVRWRPTALLSVALAASVLAGCSGNNAAPTTQPLVTAAPNVSAAPSGMSTPLVTTPPASVAAASPDVTESATPGPSLALSDPTRTLDPSLQRWPTSVINAAIALAVFDNGVKEAGTDLTTAAQQEDMVLFLGAATGLATIVEQATPSAQRLADFEATKQVGEAYLPVLTGLGTAASSLADALRSGDGAGVQSSAVQLAAALEAYRGVREAMIAVADQALLMRRSLVQ